MKQRALRGKKDRLENENKFIMRPFFTSGLNCFTNESKENRDRKGRLMASVRQLHMRSVLTRYQL